MDDSADYRIRALEREVQALRNALNSSREGERRYHSAFGSMFEAFGLAEILLDDADKPYDYRFLEVNEAFGRLTGFPPEVAKGKTVRELVPNVESYWIETYAQVALTGEPVRFENYAASLDKWFEVFAYQTVPGQFAHLFVDITQRKRSEAALRESETLFHAALDNIPRRFVIYDPERRIRFVNRAGLALSDRPAEDMLGKRDEEIWPSSLAEQYVPQLEKAYRTKKHQNFEASLTLPDGRRYIEEVHYFPLVNENGELVQCLGIGRDISDRKRMEETRRREREFRSLAEHTPDNVARYDRSLRYIYANPAMAANTGIPQEAFIGKTDRELGLPEELAAFWAEHTGGVFETGDEDLLTFHFPAPKGERYFESRLVPEFGSDGRVQTVLAVTRDLTSYKQTLEALERTTHELGERIKELNCLYEVASLTQQRMRPLAEVLRGILAALTVAYQYPEITCARISLNRERYCTEPFEQTPWVQKEEITADNRTVGALEVFYREERPPAQEGPFLREERALLSAVADLVGRGLQERNVWAARARAESALKEAQRLAHLGSWEWDEGDSRAYWSDEMFRIAGYEPQTFEIMFDSILDVVHPDERERLNEAIQNTLAVCQGFFDEHRIIRPDGSVHFVESRGEAVWGPNGEVTGVRGTWLDITQRKQVEGALRESENKYRLLVENLNEGIWLVDAEARTTFVNPRMAELLGYRVEEMLGRSLFTFMDREAAEIARRSLDRSRRGGRAEYDFELRRKDGSPLSTHIVEAPIRDEAGRYRGALAGVIDITERKRAEKQMHRANAELQQFAFVASHDLRAPLRAISNLSSWLEEDLGPQLSGEGRQSLQLLRERAHRMDAFIQQLLAYSRAGGQTVQVSPVDSVQLVREIVGSLETPEAFHIHIDGEMPRLLTDPTKLRQVFANLIGNAVKYHDRPDGQVWISARETAENIEFSVSDDGPGIPAEYHERIFQMFQRGPVQKGREGSGIGLAVVKKAVESLGGQVELISEAGSGATFRFTWPKAIERDV